MLWCLEIKIPLKVDLQKKKHYKKPQNNRKTEPTSKKISFNVSIYIFNISDEDTLAVDQWQFMINQSVSDDVRL